MGKNLVFNQNEYIENIRLKNADRSKKALIITYGCAQNETDSDKLYGMLYKMGYKKTDDEKKADIVIVNTCSVRENAELKVYGKIGSLKLKKNKNPDMVVGICGCLMQQPHASERIKKSFRFVDLVFGTHVIHEFPKMLYDALEKNKKTYSIDSIDGVIAEGIPINRDKPYKATIPIAFGCNNFCTYCIVPYVRGRERSRKSEDILTEITELSKNGLKEVTLVGQNVNSYGNDNNDDLDFPDLLNKVSKIDGIKRIRFITSHPKDLTEKLIDEIAENPKICKSLHLPFQAGNNRILKEMNRKYKREDYLRLIDRVKEKIPDAALTSDVIVGFPGETDEEFADTLDIVKKVKFDNLYTFIYSKRKDTPAEKMPDNRTYEEKLKNFNQLLRLQADICKEINDTYLGNTYEIIDEGISKTNPDARSGRTETNKVINYIPYQHVTEGDFVTVKVTETKSFSMNGKQIQLTINNEQ